MRSIDCQHPSPFALHHLPPPPPPPLPPSLPSDPRHAISLPCPRTHLFSLSFSFIRRSLLCRDLLSTSTSARGRLFSPFRPRARARALLLHYFSHLCFCSLHSARRRAAVSLGYGTIICLYGENGCFRAMPRRTRPNRKTILAICNLSRMRDM